LVVCKFGHWALSEEHYARLVSAATGRRYEEAELLQVGERIWNLERLINMARGFGRKDDTLPERVLREGAPSGPAKGRVVDLEPMLAEYYRFRGWSRDGAPSERKLADLGLEAYGKRVQPC
ncbi:MAG TPA: aldehyde ferredoxin oxidoreductase C-terminal domain-containing protein, partial [Chloroflexota bacterium]|nr:aldehyde ferredoxin oxidoreductase C-terminal domain-containing protein [Chloroflexota bacterium]